MRPSLFLVVALGAVLAASALLNAAFPEWELWWWLPLPVVGAAALLDLLVTSRRPVALSREVSPLLTQGRRVEVVLTLGPGLPRLSRLRVYDGLPATFQAAGLPFTARKLRPREDGTLEVRYGLVPTKRGRFTFSPAWVDHGSALGFWIRRLRPGEPQTVRVFPDLRQIAGDSLTLEGAPAAGAHNVRRRGQGMEFHQLREYRQGDMARQVDGKASSRMRRLVVREMQEEQDQTILFLVDTGYRMTDVEGGVRHFDRVFEALLALASVALRQGDRVGVRAWGPDDRWVPPVRGRSAFPALVEKLFDLDARPEASSPVAALQDLLPRLSRRCLIFLMTNFREEDGEDLAALLPAFRSRHLLCTVWLRESFVDGWKERVPRDLDEALGTVMALRYDDERRRGKRRSESQGLLTLDVAPENLRGDLVRKYWEIKKRGLL